MTELINIKYTEENICRMRSEIAQLILQKSSCIKNTSIQAVSPEDLRFIFGLYDSIFFYNWFSKHFVGKMKFSLSRRMTKSAGLTLCPKNISGIKQDKLIMEIRIGIDFFLQYALIKGSKTVCGIKTNNSLDALQLVFEHELCHVIEYLYYYSSRCKGQRFKAIANNLFGHTESYHKLPTTRQIAKYKLGLCVGDIVTFKFKAKELEGIIYNINKRATVMVKDKKGIYKDKYGDKYSKFYISLNNLSKKPISVYGNNK